MRSEPAWRKLFLEEDLIFGSVNLRRAQVIYSNSINRALIGMVALLALNSAIAHHSSAMYDKDKAVSLKGAVKQFQWTNPHCWVQVLVAVNGEDQEWSVQMGPPSNLYRDGWRPGTLKVGDTITVVVHPMRDGTHGGLWISGSDADGKALGASSPAK
jgi:hypothetical protein